MRLVRRVALILSVAGLPAALFAQSDSPEKAARAVLEGKCAACHGPARMSDLDVRGRAGLLKGGKRGPAIVPGKAARPRTSRSEMRAGPWHAAHFAGRTTTLLNAAAVSISH